MDNYIIKGAGTIDEILTALKTLSAVFGKKATLSEVETATRYGKVLIAEEKQFKNNK